MEKREEHVRIWGSQSGNVVIRAGTKLEVIHRQVYVYEQRGSNYAFVTLQFVS